MSKLDLRGEAARLGELLKASKRTVFFGGAGVSTESGVPDFRSAQGIFTQNLGAEHILTPRYLSAQPEAFYRFYREYFILDKVAPNACHLALAELERRGLLSAVVTQNVDNLHQAAGSRRVLELHGSGERFYCMRCGQESGLAAVRAMPEVPRCACGGLLRPDIVLYEEGLDAATLNEAAREIAAADLLIVGGTSLQVYPAAGLVHLQKPEGRKVLIDLGAEPGPHFALTIREALGRLFAALMEYLDKR